MEDSMKGMLITFTIVGIFIMSIINFTIMFPVEQGFVFSQVDNTTYLTLAKMTYPNLTDLSDTADVGFNEWDLEVGYMGSNTQKASKEASSSYVSNVVNSFDVVISEVFTTADGSIHPMVIVFGILTSMLGVYVTFLFIKFLRTGN